MKLQTCLYLGLWSNNFIINVTHPYDIFNQCSSKSTLVTNPCVALHQSPHFLHKTHQSLLWSALLRNPCVTFIPHFTTLLFRCPHSHINTSCLVKTLLGKIKWEKTVAKEKEYNFAWIIDIVLSMLMLRR